MLSSTCWSSTVARLHTWNSRKRKMQTFCTISSEYCFKSIPLLRGKYIFSSNDGWLLLRDNDNLKMFTLWNPASSQVIHLPPWNALDDGVRISCALVCPPREDDDGRDFNVFLFAEGVAFSYRPYRDNNTWVAQSTKILGQRAAVEDAITCNGVVYAHVYVSSGIEFEGDEYPQHSFFAIIEVNNHDSDFDGPLPLRLLEVERVDAGFNYIGWNKHLLASCGRVYTVTIHTREADRRMCAVSIWELDLCMMTWVRVNCLEGRAFFVGAKSCTGCWGSTDHNDSGGVKQNTVYFEISGTDGFSMPKALYSYNLEDDSFTALLSCRNLPSFWDMPIWFMPQYQSKISESSDALSLIFDEQKQNDVLDKFLLLSELPFDLIASVAQHMHLFDYMKFRATCKAFRSIAPVARWRTNNSYPLLMFFETKEPLCRLMDPCRSDSCYMVLPESYGCIVQIDYSKDGWLLLRTDKGDSLQFFNPFTRVRGDFPSFEFLDLLSSVGFSSSPTSFDCVTVGMQLLSEDFLTYYHRFEEKMWHECHFDRDEAVEFRPAVISSPVYYKGAFYFLDRKGYLGVFRLINEEGTWEIHNKPQTPGDGTFHSSHLVECGGELLSVFIGDMGKWICVFRFDQTKKKWVTVKSLGNHVLFVGPSSSSSVLAAEPGMANRIYLPRRRGDGKYSTLSGEESFEDLSGTKEHGRCCWI
ncbi:hypothetical protein Cgig2_031678 [Carnegiea gigantea]|uniref:F-box domain-containing protein n=1 Tax=Carnegiea gigantea TaxID=171969 RepID=A0A9Q1KRI8_9CARY|nr:hypothetical protein Cgig2_031678 [Carnegiea gigantea]